MVGLHYPLYEAVLLGWVLKKAVLLGYFPYMASSLDGGKENLIAPGLSTSGRGGHKVSPDLSPVLSPPAQLLSTSPPSLPGQ